ncbi:TIGR03067 domain-containing protein [Singulisphaera sp. Ch08]|uniref:TIGR03067 domain-containing protein n=1 Tax=Singulisphaera sp. Ch08 TaxID=3120278 RepID=A0AAU7CIC4_9BACT
MKASRFVPLIAVLVPLLAAAADDSSKGDLAKFQGKWKTSIGPEKNIALTVQFKGNAVTASASTPDGQSFELKGEIKLDESAKPFKTIDWVKFTGPDGNDSPDNKGVYEVVDADTIKVCNGGPGNDRPTEFKEGDGAEAHVIILKREKD